MRSSVVQGFGAGIVGLYVTLIASGTCLAQQCVGDCDGDNAVQINELILGINVLLGDTSVAACPAIDCAQPHGLVVNCAIEAVANALDGCSPPTQLPTATPTPTKTCYTPATPIPDRICAPSQCEFAQCVDYGIIGTCKADSVKGGCFCYIEGPTFTITPTSCSTPTPPPPTLIPPPERTYELTRQSRMRLPDGTEENATGQVVVSPCLSPNTYFAYRIDSVAIHSQTVVITDDPQGERGIIEAVTLYPDDSAVSFGTAVFINGASGQLGGFGPIDESRNGQTLTLELNAVPYTLHMEAVRDGPLFTPFNGEYPCPGR